MELEDFSSSSSLSSHDSPSHLQSNSPSPTHARRRTFKRKAGRKKFRETRHPVYHGVRQREGNKWVCEVREPQNQSRIWLGTFHSPEMAARAYDVAALALRGNSAPLNFPDSQWLAPRPKSCSPKDIQAAAATVIDAFPHKESFSSSSCESCDSGISKNLSESARDYYIDEDEVFNMPGILADMAAGLLISPPMPDDFQYGECLVDLSLWSK